jgi:hypothetical protein
MIAAMSWFRALVLPVVVTVAVAAPMAAASSARSHAPEAHSAAAQVRLVVSNLDPLQLRGVTLRVVSTLPTIVAYYFRFGDGDGEVTAVPLASHGYAKPGTYHATVAVAQRGGAVAVSKSVTIHVRYGLPPAVSITTPRPGEQMTLGSTGLVLAGHASAPDGIRRVQLAIQLISSNRRYVTHGGCVWYDAKRGLVLTSCQNPYFFDAIAAHGGWHFHIPGSATIPAGVYVIRVRAVDRVGNESSAYTERQRTILPFTVRRT